MTWNDFYQRQHAIHSVLEHAEQPPNADLPVPECFADIDELLAALQYKWTQTLTGHIDIGLAEDQPADNDQLPDEERVQVVTNAWHRAAKDNSGLRTLLDRHADEPGPAFRAAREREHRMLALKSGLAGDDEPIDSVTRIGSAFLRLLHATPTAHPKRRARGPMRHSRRLIPGF